MIKSSSFLTFKKYFLPNGYVDILWFCRNQTFLPFIFRSIIYRIKFYIYEGWGRNKYLLFLKKIQLTHYYLLKRPFFISLLNFSRNVVVNQVSIYKQICFWTPYAVPLVKTVYSCTNIKYFFLIVVLKNLGIWWYESSIFVLLKISIVILALCILT